MIDEWLTSDHPSGYIRYKKVDGIYLVDGSDVLDSGPTPLAVFIADMQERAAAFVGDVEIGLEYEWDSAEIRLTGARLATLPEIQKIEASLARAKKRKAQDAERRRAKEERDIERPKGSGQTVTL